MQFVRQPISRADLSHVAASQFGDMVKAVVDVAREIMVIGGELHSDEEALLLDDGSLQDDLWGINLYPAESDREWIEFDAIINVRPRLGNRSRSVEDLDLQASIRRIVASLVRAQ